MPWKAAIVVAAVLSLPLAVRAQTLELTEGAWELTLGQVTFPTNTFGVLSFRDCASCTPKTLSVEAETTYATAQGQLPLREFLQRIDDLSSPATPVTVFYSLSSGRVTRVRVHDDDR